MEAASGVRSWCASAATISPMAASRRLRQVSVTGFQLMVSPGSIAGEAGM